jgi:hypothetical protein
VAGGFRRRLELPARIGGLLPRVEVVDLRRDGGYPFTRPLLDALAGLDDRGGRAILLQNRRVPRGAALPDVRPVVALPALRRVAGAARARAAGLP